MIITLKNNNNEAILTEKEFTAIHYAVYALTNNLCDKSTKDPTDMHIAELKNYYTELLNKINHLGTKI